MHTVLVYRMCQPPVSPSAPIGVCNMMAVLSIQLFHSSPLGLSSAGLYYQVCYLLAALGPLLAYNTCPLW